jgi:hypothetical protein
MNLIKSTLRNRLIDENLESCLKLKTTYKPDLTKLSKELLSCTHEAEWTPFQTHYFSENLVVAGLEPGINNFLYNVSKVLVQDA